MSLDGGRNINGRRKMNFDDKARGQGTSGKNRRRRRRIVAKALDGQRYPLPLCEYMWGVKVGGAAAPKEPMTYAW